jgi:hypothetical protein
MSSIPEPPSAIVKDVDAAEAPPLPEQVTGIVEAVELPPPAHEIKPDETPQPEERAEKIFIEEAAPPTEPAEVIVIEEAEPVEPVQEILIEPADPPAELVREVIVQENVQPAEPAEYVVTRADTVPTTLPVETVHEVIAQATTPPPLEEVYQIPTRANTVDEQVFLVAQRGSIGGTTPLPPVYYVPTRANTTGDLPTEVFARATTESPKTPPLEVAENVPLSIEESPRQRLVKVLSRRNKPKKPTKKNLKKLDRQNAEVNSGDLRTVNRKAKFIRLLLRLRQALGLLRRRVKR